MLRPSLLTHIASQRLERHDDCVSVVQAIGFALGATLVLATAVGPHSAGTGPEPGSEPATEAGGAVHAVRVLGTTREGRRVVAYRVGAAGAHRTAVVLSTMHGNERDTVDIVTNLRDGNPVRGLDLWLVPVYNPDGYAHHDRHNARGVDLNRNYPYRWASSTDDSGSKPASERETRLFMRFFDRVDPDLVVSFHQPLNGVDTSHRKRPGFLRRLRDELRLPLKRMDCDGGCHGTLTQWFNRRHDGFAVTVELPADPSAHYLDRRGPRALLRALGASRRR